MPNLNITETVLAHTHDTDKILSALTDLITNKGHPDSSHKDTVHAASVALLRASKDPSVENVRKLCEEWLTPWRTNIRKGILRERDDEVRATQFLKILEVRSHPHQLYLSQISIVNQIVASTCPVCRQGINKVGDRNSCHTCGVKLKWPETEPHELTTEKLLKTLLELALVETDPTIRRHEHHHQAIHLTRRALDKPTTANLQNAYLAWFDPRHECVKAFIISDPDNIDGATTILRDLRSRAWPNGLESEVDAT